MKDVELKPSWHSDESWQIERLDWLGSPADFERLCTYAGDRVDSELRDRGRRLSDLFSERELRQVVLKGAQDYGPRHKQIGLAIHITLWLRAIAIWRMNNPGEIVSFGDEEKPA